MFFQKNLDDSAPELGEAPRDRAPRPRQRPTRWSTTSRRSPGSRRSRPSRSTFRSGGSAARARSRTPTGWCSTSTRARARACAECAEVAQLAREHAARTWGSTRCRSRAAARASTCTRRSTARRRRDQVVRRRARARPGARGRPPRPRRQRHEEGAARAARCSSTGARTTQQDHDRAVLAARAGRARRSPCRAPGGSWTTPDLAPPRVPRGAASAIDADGDPLAPLAAGHAAASSRTALAVYRSHARRGQDARAGAASAARRARAGEPLRHPGAPRERLH